MFRRIIASELTQLTPRRICLIKPSALGDVVQTIPLLPVLKQCYPEAEISWVVNRELRDLIDGHPALHESIPFERRGGWSAWITLLKTLRERRFDLVFDLQGLLRSAVMTAVTGARVRVGMETAREGSRYTLNCMIPNSGRDVPAHARYWRVADVLGFGETPRQTKIVTSDADQAWAITQLQELPRPIFAVHPGARWVTKRWPVEKFADLMRRADRQWSGSVLILGSKAERPDADQLTNLLAEKMGTIGTSRIKNLAGQSTLKQLTSLLERVDFAISNDSGPMHLAAGLDIPTLGLFTCTSAIRSGPPGSMHELVSTKVACAAGYHKTCPHHGAEHLSCLRELGVSRAWSALQRLVDKNATAQRVA
ncbi:glycosyltransferase family 9 protein [Schlesneria paludicola]|uniref:glycosyltransferase family 9 protein n=1 Tax=Schlesneria paludicola TaxID=360056 RepID=UPI00029B54FD|nr:glycosyltransferase family 9 protein [Schlesneria paludicola]